MFRKFLYFFILFIIGIYVQSSVAEIILPSFFIPDLILVLVVYISLSVEKHRALIGSFILGILSDFASGLYVGPFALGYILACIFVRGISKHVYADRFFSVVLVVFLSSLIKQLCSRLLVFAFIGFSSLSEFSISIWIGQALMTSFLAPFLLRFILTSRGKTSFSV